MQTKIGQFLMEEKGLIPSVSVIKKLFHAIDTFMEEYLTEKNYRLESTLLDQDWKKARPIPVYLYVFRIFKDHEKMFKGIISVRYNPLKRSPISVVFDLFEEYTPEGKKTSYQPVRLTKIKKLNVTEAVETGVPGGVVFKNKILASFDKQGQVEPKIRDIAIRAVKNIKGKVK